MVESLPCRSLRQVASYNSMPKSLSCCVKVTRYTIVTVLTCPCSQVLVMHDGTTLEYDTVPNLLRMQQGAFRAMVEGAGISHEALNY